MKSKVIITLFILSVVLPLNSFSQVVFHESFESGLGAFEDIIIAGNSDTGWGVVEEGPVVGTAYSFPNTNFGSRMAYIAGTNTLVNSTFTEPRFDDDMNTTLYTKEYNVNNEFYEASSHVYLYFKMLSMEARTFDNFEVFLYFPYSSDLVSLNIDGLNADTEGIWVTKQSEFFNKIRDGEPFRIYFRFTSNGSFQGEGLYIDEVTFEYNSKFIQPSLTFPANGAKYFNVPGEIVKLEWNSSPYAREYIIQIDDNTSFEDPIHELKSTSAATSFSLDWANLGDGKYYWRVKAKNGIIESLWSDYRTFQIVDEILNFDQEGISFNPTDPKQKFVSVNSNAPWGYDINGNWISVDKNNGGLYINVDEYTQENNRIGSVDIFSEISDASDILVIKQEGLQLSISPSELNFKSQDNYKSISVQSNTNWTVNNPPENFAFLRTDDGTDEVWSGNGSMDLRVYVSDYGDTEDRLDEIVFRTEVGDLTPEVLVVNQEGIPITAPVSPSLDTPADGAPDQPLTPTLDWNSVSNADTYRLQVSTNSSFSNLVVNETETGTQHTVSDGALSYGTTYYWRVRASNEGGSSNWSEERSFTTEQEPVSPPATPSLDTPDDGALDQLLTPTLDWNSVSNADTYRLQVSTNSSFSSLVVDETKTGTEHTVADGALSYGTTYYWRVRASNEGGNSNWSEERSFTTETEPVSPPESPPNLVYPYGGDVGLPLTLTFKWDPVTNADTYHLQVTTSEFSNSVIDQTTSATQYEVKSGQLSYNTTYFWRMKASNSAGSSEWSPVPSFSTMEDPGTVPDLVVSDLSISPSSPKEGDTITFSFAISNQGDEGAGTFDWQVNVDGSEAENGSITSLDVGETYNETTAVSNVQIGSHNVQVIVDVNNDIDEYNETNNEASASYEVQGTQNDIIFAATTSSYTENDDLITVCKDNFGSDATLADWTDIEAYYQNNSSLNSFFEEVQLNEQEGKNMLVQRNGNRWYTSDRHYFIARHDGNKPSGFLAHDNINSYELSLGSWYGLNYRVLCLNPENSSPTVSIDNGPSEGSILNFNDPAFAWSGNDSDGTVDGYEIELQGLSDTSFSTTVTTYQFTNLENSEYTFRVRGIDNEGIVSSWATRNFTVDVTSTVIANYSEGWNLISIPEELTGQSMADYFNDISNSDPFEFAGQYERIEKTEALTSGKGYWLKLDADQEVEFTGQILQSLTLNLEPGWNLVGTVGQPLSVPGNIQDPNNIIENGKVWGLDYDDNTGTYELVETSEMLPGKGYFIKATSAGEIVLSK